MKIKISDLRSIIREVISELGGHIYGGGSAGPGESTGKFSMIEKDIVTKEDEKISSMNDEKNND